MTSYLVLVIAGCGWWPKTGEFLYVAASVHEISPGKLSRSYTGIWDQRRQPAELLHLVLYPHGTKVISEGQATPDAIPSKVDVSSTPRGLWVDGVLVPTQPGRRVFVYTQANTMRPVPLTPAEEALLTPAAMRTLGTTALWRDKIEPVLEEERWSTVPPR